MKAKIQQRGGTSEEQRGNKEGKSKKKDGEHKV